MHDWLAVRRDGTDRFLVKTQKFEGHEDREKPVPDLRWTGADQTSPTPWRPALAVLNWNASMWKRTWEQVALKEMPPRRKSHQPTLPERLELSQWITDGMTKAMQEKGGFTNHLRPSRGNYLDHDLLFNTKLENIEPASTPARIWRIHPQDQLVRLNDLICLKRPYDPQRPGLWTRGDHIPSNLEGETKDYFGLDQYVASFGDAYIVGVSGFQSSLSMIRDHGLRNYAHLYSVNSAEATQKRSCGSWPMAPKRSPTSFPRTSKIFLLNIRIAM